MTAAGDHSDEQAHRTADETASEQDSTASTGSREPEQPGTPPEGTEAGTASETPERAERPAEPESPRAADSPDTVEEASASDRAELASAPFPETEKQALIESMTALRDSDMHLATRARKIRALQDTWHAHGTPDEADPLWQQFNELGREAFEPCKAYFQERKKLMRHNLAERKQICEQLEAWVSSLDDSKEADIGEVNRLEKQARDQWKKFAPVPQKQVAALQGRFNDVLKSLRNARRKTLQAHAVRKKQLVQQVEALLESEDLPAALQEAKRLQKEWKQVGPAPHKDERQLWETFRKHCDALFARRPAPSGKPARKQGPGGPRDQARDNRKSAAPPRPRIGKKHQALLDTLRPVAKLCQEAEEQRLAGQSPDLEALRESRESARMPAEGREREALRQRFEQLENADAETLKKLASDNAEQARILCIELEIQAGLDSPAEDRPVRMQRQLEHLKQGLGQGLTDAATRSQKLGESLITLLCMGPLTSADRQAFDKRLQRIR
ncbi:MAG: DUF349 domain-containing protein [Pseudomonadota bacterium]